jgi:DNA-binding MarR family transcriptional regulator
VNAESIAEVMPSQLRLVVTRLHRRLRQETGSDITASQLSALVSVERLGPISLKDLAEMETISPPSMTRISTHLEQQGLVVRVVDAADRRVARLAITDSGRLLLAKTRSRRDAFLAERLADLEPDQREALARALPILERLVAE